MKQKVKFLPLTLIPLLFACTTMPTGPRVMALPGTGKSFDQFRADDLDCQRWAMSRTGSPDQMATDSGVKSAVVGTAVGALAGAALGGNRGAATGAGTGLLVGSMAGVGAADASGHAAQRVVDQAYIQCMYSKGQRVPVAGQFVTMPAAKPAVTTPNVTPPPPPPGSPPPPYATTPPPPPPGSPPPPPPR